MIRLSQEEYVEQAYFFRSVEERLSRNEPVQDIMASVRDEILATTNLPMAIDFMRAELNHSGMMSLAMKRLSHYFTPFQTFIAASSEDERGRFDLRVGLKILQHDAAFRTKDPGPAATFFYQFETLCRNRLDYDRGLEAIAADPFYNESWRKWLLMVRKQIGLIELTDLVYVASEHYLEVQRRRGIEEPEAAEGVLFGVKEGKIALANRRKDPLLFFQALQRQLGYPAVPRLEKHVEDPKQTLYALMRRFERLEMRVKLLEDEQREGGIDLSRFAQRRDEPPTKI